MTASNAGTTPEAGGDPGSDLETLWRPVRIGELTVKNRILVSAHQTHFPMEEDDLVGERYIAYMEARARGGAGLLVVEAGAIHPSTEKVGLLSLFREASIPGLRKLANAVHGHGTRIFAQLSHLGSQDLGNSHIDKWHPVVAPSPLPSTVYGRVAQAIDEDEIASVVAGYGQAAVNTQTAGLDGAEIAAAHGYLMTQFLSPLTNKRTDRYGGSTEDRCRFAIEAATEIRRRCGRPFPLGIRLSFDEFLGEAGITPRVAEEIVRTLHGRDCSITSISVVATTTRRGSGCRTSQAAATATSRPTPSERRGWSEMKCRSWSLRQFERSSVPRRSSRFEACPRPRGSNRESGPLRDADPDRR